ncbi:uncharacterized protein MELLADRAFT_69191 [Melampsora larici-populina 98AG31]|uniref:Uncharacterized protein n=1 Tax=Melampsora larici-populina (strain 98AG31 / pathotype 3-4-7) TaxID=747676 RepID=F4S9Q9_MELLP|nr:uncharacterized protein MELLADRAFT_69191 [Melampsora larici-populina 98AG31]EGF98618.1 hypothetical protein MELLADRAFT_69191 [Melampsora larici-populina 98AG31]
MAARLAAAEENVARLTRATSAATGILPGPALPPPSRSNAAKGPSGKTLVEDVIEEENVGEEGEGVEDGEPMDYGLLLDGELLASDADDDSYVPVAQPKGKGRANSEEEEGSLVMAMLISRSTAGEDSQVDSPTAGGFGYESVTLEVAAMLENNLWWLSRAGITCRMSFPARASHIRSGGQVSYRRPSSYTADGDEMVKMQGEIDDLYSDGKFQQGAALLAYFTDRFLRERSSSERPTPGPSNRPKQLPVLDTAEPRQMELGRPPVGERQPQIERRVDPVERRPRVERVQQLPELRQPSTQHPYLEPP